MLVTNSSNSSGTVDFTIMVETAYNGPTWHVDTTGSDVTGDGSTGAPLATIQTAINAASDGDTVLVQPGTYVENINFNGKNIVVQGENRETTIIDGNQSGTVVTFDSGETSVSKLDGFTISNGHAAHSGGIWCKNTSSPTITNCNIVGNTASYDGGGINISDSASPSINNCLIDSNESGGGGGIYFNTMIV